MNFQEYITSAERTESKPDQVLVNKEYLDTVIKLLVAAGNLLDVIKKDSWYGLPTSESKITARSLKLKTALDAITESVPKLPSLTGIDKLDKQPLELDKRITHGIIGSVTESIELLEAYQTATDRGDYDKTNIKEELGDIYWYLAIILSATGADWENILETNISKLLLRNQAKIDSQQVTFNAKATIDRDVDAERQLLERQLN